VVQAEYEDLGMQSFEKLFNDDLSFHASCFPSRIGSCGNSDNHFGNRQKLGLYSCDHQRHAHQRGCALVELAFHLQESTEGFR
jgi:hypothetical protein